MENLFFWVIAAICLFLPFWLLYNSWNKNRLLDERLENCDDGLLTDSSVKVTQIISAPMGTTITENATVVAAPIYSDKVV